MRSDFRSHVNNLERKDKTRGFSIFTTYVIDTLNMNELIIDENKIKFSIERDGKRIDLTPATDIEENILTRALTIAQLHKDTLVISVGIPFFPIISHSISGTSVTSSYEEYYEGDSVLRLNLNTAKVSALNIPITTTRFSISTVDFSSSKPIYGLVEFETQPYYMDSNDFKSGYLKQKLKGRYVFKVRVRKESLHY